MSNYTTQLRYICESVAGYEHSTGFDNVDRVIASARDRIFSFDYPLYKGADRVRLESAILLAYYTREIGFETYGLWKLRLMAKMRNIMPYFNQLYESADLKYNPLHNVDYFDEYHGKNEGGRENTNVNTTTIDETNKSAKTGKNEDITNGTVNSHSLVNGSDSNTRKFSDTPQGGLKGLNADEYLTEAETNSSTNTQTGDVTNTDNTNVTHNFGETTSNSRNAGNTSRDDLSMQEKFVDDNKRHVYGKMGGESIAKMIEEYRQTILNIDAMIIEELEPLFMGLW